MAGTLSTLWLWFWHLLPGNPILVRVVQGASRRQRHLWLRAGYLAALLMVVLALLVVSLQGKGGSLHELAELCTHVGIIERGELLFHGPIKEILQRVKTCTKVHVRVVEQQDLAAQLLQKTKGVKSVEQSDGQLIVELTRQTHDFTALTRLLIDNNFKIREVREEEINLETAFMRMTKGMVQ